MAFWCRIGKSKLQQFSNQFKSFPHASLLNPTLSHTKSCLTPNSYSITIHNTPTEFCSNVRFFAAPVQFQAKPSKEDSKASGPRINEKITAQVIRLVMDNEHTVVSRDEALDRARKLNLDLVEVQGTANPPVCKIMDFHKEKYVKQVRVKDRVKSKGEAALKTASAKEVRFSGKIEQKDLQMKADTVKRLMESGYRVKCHAKGSGDQDVLGILSRLSALIEDVTVVESGPLMGKDGAYVIVRHVKFGLPKKGTAKKMTALVDANSGVQKDSLTSTPDSPGVIDDVNAVNSDVDSNEESFSDEDDQDRSSNSDFRGSDKRHSFRDSKRSPETSHITENRYKKGVAKNQFSPTTGMDNKGTRESTRLESHFSNQGRQPPRDTRFSQQTRESEEASTNGPGFRSYRPPPNDATKREPFSPRPGYGNFGGSKPNHGVEAKVGENKEGNRYSVRSPAPRGGLASDKSLPNSKSEGRQPHIDTSRQGGRGRFSSEGANASPNRMPK
ncbi:translation initiation factor IF3-1, mitochondrial-like [Humulus lupulus]|uniref:translation initiation factor IF3-1, mitochondrial-like n=1 Tax=Humulus lupulus TaxID=3486 RepID=UPI002B4055C6|nr:translation initiation factor IF3-1, mitochondrial-like [Humulus lupulus]